MNKNIKEPPFDSPTVYPIAESNNIIVVQQIKESYDEDYKWENNFSQQYCNSSFDNSQHCNVIGKCCYYGYTTQTVNYNTLKT